MGSQGARLIGANGMISSGPSRLHQGELYVEPGTLLVKWRPVGDNEVPPELQAAETSSESRTEGE